MCPQLSPLHPWRKPRPRWRIHVPHVLENRHGLRTKPVLCRCAVGSHTADVQAAVILGSEGGQEVGAGLGG